MKTPELAVGVRGPTSGRLFKVDTRVDRVLCSAQGCRCVDVMVKETEGSNRSGPTGFIEEPWTQEVDPTTLEKVSGSFVSDDLRDREDDIIWRVRWKDQWVYVYLLTHLTQSSYSRASAVLSSMCSNTQSAARIYVRLRNISYSSSFSLPSTVQWRSVSWDTCLCCTRT